MRIALKRLAIGTALAAASVASPSYAEFLVTRSSGEIAREYPRGARIPETTVLTLGDGESVTLLTNTGTRRFAGPGRFFTADLPSLASNFFWSANRQSENPRVAVARMEVGPPPPDMLRPFAYLWAVDLNRSAHICYVFENLLVTRFSAFQIDGLESVSFIRSADGERRMFRYDADFGDLVNDQGWLQGWPVGLTIHPGDEFQIAFATTAESSQPEPVTLTFHELMTDPFEGLDPSLERPEFIGQVLGKLTEIAGELETNGCDEQLVATRNTIERYREELADPDYYGPSIPSPPGMPAGPHIPSPPSAERETNAVPEGKRL